MSFRGGVSRGAQPEGGVSSAIEAKLVSKCRKGPSAVESHLTSPLRSSSAFWKTLLPLRPPSASGV